MITIAIASKTATDHIKACLAACDEVKDGSAG